MGGHRSPGGHVGCSRYEMRDGHFILNEGLSPIERLIARILHPVSRIPYLHERLRNFRPALLEADLLTKPSLQKTRKGRFPYGKRPLGQGLLF
jgi:hypothetical protein